MGNDLGISKINYKLGVPIIGKIETASLFKSSSRTMVLGCYVLLPDNTVPDVHARLFNILTVTLNKISMNCLLTGESRQNKYTPSSNVTITSSVFSSECISNKKIIIAESNGGFAVVNPWSLKIEKRFGLSNVLTSLTSKKDHIQTMISIAPEILYVGYSSGLVKVWHTEVGNPQFEFGKEDPPVRSIGYSSKHRKVIIGFQFSSEDRESYLKVYLPNASQDQEKSEPSVIENFCGTCLSITVIDRLDLFLATSSENSEVFIWNIETLAILARFSLSNIGAYPVVLTQSISIERPDSTYLVLGSSDGSAVVCKITQNTSTPIEPLKKILIHQLEKFGVSYLRYEERIDTLIIGNTFGTGNLISNFFSDGFNEKLSVENHEKLDDS